jgi:hypothetical protein
MGLEPGGELAAPEEQDEARGDLSRGDLSGFPKPDRSARERQAILERLRRGEIPAEEAAEAIRKLGNGD